MDLKFKIGNTSQINNTEIDEGSFLVDKEKGQILIDTDEKKRIAISGGVGEAIDNGGEIFNDYENNQANTLYSHAEGYNTLAGAKVFWASEGSVENKTYTLDSVEGIEVGDYYSYKCVPNEEAGITYNGTFDFCGTITAINGNTVTVSIFITGQNSAFQSGYFWIPRKPTIGTIIPELELWQHTEGSNTRAIMGAGHAEGNNTVASGRWSHAEGKGTIAGYGSHAEGRGTEARGLDSHSEGFHTVAQDEGAHAEGDHTVAKGNGAHVEGIGKTSDVANEFAGGMRPDETYGALATAAHSEGYQTRATATAAHSEGKTTIASGNDSHAEGDATRAEGHHSHSEGSSTKATAENAHAEGGITEANGSNSHSEGLRSVTTGGASHAEGSNTQAKGARAHTEGDATYASGYASHAEGGGSSNQYAIDKQSTYGAFGDYSHSEGLRTTAIGKASHTEGEKTQAVAQNSHAEGYNTIAKGYASHTEGEQTTTKSSHAHAEGFNTEAKEDSAHAEGYATHAYGIGAHSEGFGSVAEAQGAHAEGINTIAPIEGSHAQGKYNKITKDILAKISLDGVIRAEATENITKTNDGITWNLNNVGGINHYCFSYSEFIINNKYKLRLTLNASKAATTDLNFYAWEDLSKINSSGKRVELDGTKSISLVKGENIIYSTVTFKTYGYLAMRFMNVPEIDATVTLTKLEIVVAEEIDNTIISSIGNGFDKDNRSNAFTVYKDGHAEVGKMGDTAKSIVTKEYANNFANALKGSKNGSTIIIDDISPITHKLSVKLSNNEYITYAEGYTTSGVDFEFEQLPDTILKTSPINSSEQYNNFDLIHADGNYTFLISVGESGRYEGDVYYTKIVLGDDKAYVYYYSDSNYTTLISSSFWNYSTSSPIVGIRFNGSQTVYYTAQTKYIPLTSVKVIVKNNNGETVAEYTPNADGTVDGVKSLYPTTVITTDTDGVTIDCEYNRDINKFSGILTEYVKYTDINQSYDPLSENAQSGKAVAEAISKISTGDSEASGVHVGAEEPTDDNINVWIDIDEEADIISTEVTEIENGHRVSITDTNGTKSFDVLNGDNGYTPVKGVDYWTDEDVESINSNAETFIIDELAKIGQLKPEFANSIDECIDTSKLYVLPDGFIYAYITKTAIKYPTNQIEHAIDSSKNPYNDGKGYKDNYRLSISSGETAQNGYTTTGFIKVNQGSTIRFANIDTTTSDTNIFIIFYDSNFSWIGYLRNEAATNVLKAGECVLDSNLTLSSGTLDGAVYFRVSMKTGNGNYLITVNEPLEPTTTTTQSWHNTGHAFVPAYYEDRIVSLENRIDELSHSNNTTFTYITGEAKRVADIVKEKQTVGSLTFAAMSDMHIRSSNDSYWADNITSCRDAGFGLTELQRFLKLDYAAMLGDYTVGGANDTIAQVKKDISYVKNCITNGTKGIPTIWCTGNHDINYGANTDRRMTEDEMYAYVTGNNKGTVQDGDNVGRNYGYIDFENQRIRCIYLNTVDVFDYPDNTDGTADDAMEITAIQAQWLVDVGLNLIDKKESTKWGIIVLSHHCLSQFQPITTILTAYKDGINGSVDVTTNGVTTTVNYNFTSANRGEIICAVHGHDHNFTYRKISTERWDKITEGNAWLWSICIPNMDTTRNNEKATNSEVAYAQAFGEFDVNGNPVYYPKTQRTAKSTSFCVITIDRKNRKIYVAAYGAGYDREINY